MGTSASFEFPTVPAIVVDTALHSLTKGKAGYYNITLSRNDEWRGGRGAITGITVIHNAFILQKHPPKAAF